MMKTNSVKTKKNKNSHKKKKGDKVVSEEDGEELDESSEEELDLTKECHPIGHYINDRAEMINQMFSVIKGNKLKAMLPPILKNCDTEQLKLQCLDQLLGMSSKRITCIIEGEILDTSSESEVPSDNENEDSSRKGSSSSDRSSDSAEDTKLLYKDDEKDRRKRKRKRKAESQEKDSSKSAKVEQTPVPEQGKTLLELLELEMRARAIRALLEKGNEVENASESKSNQEQTEAETGDVVDLTNCEDDEDFPLPSNKKTNDVEQDIIDQKVNSFEQKVDKQKEVEKVTNQEAEEAKKQKLKAELELRNKLFKKKIYRTRHQRTENDENSVESENIKETVENIVIKEEPVEPTEPEEIVIEDPEEGEVSTDEDEAVPVEVKQEPEETVEDEQDVVRTDVEFISTYPALQVSTVEPCPPDHEPADVDQVNTDVIEEDKIEDEDNIQQKADVSESLWQEQPEADESDDPENSSWHTRWFLNNKVQTVVKSSKIFSKVKKRMINADKNQKINKEEPVVVCEEVNAGSNTCVPPPQQQQQQQQQDVIEGSVEEYQRLISKNIDDNSSTSSPAHRDESCVKEQEEVKTD